MAPVVVARTGGRAEVEGYILTLFSSLSVPSVVESKQADDPDR